MMSERQLWCADTTLSLAVQIAAEETGASEQELLKKIAASPAYDALYDEGTKLWATGPAYLLDYIWSLGVV